MSLEETRLARSLGRDDVFDDVFDDVDLGVDEAEAYHSEVARLLYLAKRTRPDILTVVSHLCSRVQCPTRGDSVKLGRVLDYLFNTRTKSLVFHNGEVKLTAYIDASFGIHVNGESRSGTVLCVNGVYVAAWSSKQKLVSKSSTESELIALTDGSTYVLWAREWLLSQGYSGIVPVVYQDNMSVLSLGKTGRHPGQRTKHLNIRYFFVFDRVAKNEIILEYLPTKSMIADLMTKPVNGALFIKLVGLLFGDRGA